LRNVRKFLPTSAMPVLSVILEGVVWGGFFNAKKVDDGM
jgi:hypothetical protein